MMQPKQASPQGVNVNMSPSSAQQPATINLPSVPHQPSYGMMSTPVSNSPQLPPQQQIPIRTSRTDQGGMSTEMMQRDMKPLRGTWKQPRAAGSASENGTAGFTTMYSATTPTVIPSDSYGVDQMLSSTSYPHVRPQSQQVSPQQQQQQPQPHQQSVLENLINSPQFGSQPSSQKMYADKLRVLRPYCESLKAKAQQCRMEGNEDAAKKFDMMCGVLEGRTRVSFEYLQQIEAWIYKKQEFLSGTRIPPASSSPSQPQPLVDAVNAVLLNGDTSQTAYDGRLPSGNAPAIPGAQWQSSPMQNSPHGPPTILSPLGLGNQPMSTALPPPPHLHGQQSQMTSPHGAPLQRPLDRPPTYYSRHSPYPQPQHIRPNAPQYQQQQQPTGRRIPPRTVSSFGPLKRRKTAPMAPISVSSGLPAMDSAIRESCGDVGGNVYGNGVEDLYGMDDFLPTPLEALSSNSLSQMGGQLPESARCEFMSLPETFIVDPNFEQTQDSSGVIVKCTLTSYPVPPLRLVIPRTYPNGMITVDRAALDLDSFFFDDLQNVIHEQLARPGLRTITDYLTAWEATVRNYHMEHPQQTTLPTSFDDIFAASTFDDILS
ncbi:hypothetical protein AB6A40_005498 [Gnathostoma spinigerum]|uniref:Mediator complex subunit 15 n=1 Tax=Gnathostoma spinigerum TaxID=75299 RepID=A0ABD6EKV5_9BILA